MVLVREHQRRELCFTEVLISGSLTHCSLTPHLDLPPPPQGWGMVGPFLGVVITSLSSHT